MDKYVVMRLLLNLFELLACITGFFYWRKIRHSIWKWFVVYLAIITLTEVSLEFIGYILHKPGVTVKVTLYFLIPFEFLFFLVLFYFWFDNRKVRLWILAGIILYLISFLIDMAFLGKTRFWFYSFSYTTGNIILLMAEFLFFYIYKFINSREILQYKSSMMFWTCTGLLIFYLGSLPFYGLWNTLLDKYPVLFNNYWIVGMCMGCVMYLFFCFAFIWGKPK